MGKTQPYQTNQPTRIRVLTWHLIVFHCFCQTIFGMIVHHDFHRQISSSTNRNSDDTHLGGGGFGGVEFGGFQRRGEATEKNTDVGSKTEVEQLEGFLFSYISN